MQLRYLRDRLAARTMVTTAWLVSSIALLLFLGLYLKARPILTRHGFLQLVRGTPSIV